MLRITEALVIVIVYLLLAPFARGQTLNGKLLRLNPTALPTMCAIGDLRVDSGDSYKLKLCNALNTWDEIIPTGAIINPMTTAGDLIYGGVAGAATRLAAGSGLLHSGATPSWSLLVNADVSGSAAIAYPKLNLTGAILNADLAGSIADTKLDTIATALKVSNSATTATSANTNSAIVARDGSGNFSAGTITAALTGNVTGNLTGDVTGNVSGSSGSTTGNAATATALAANPADCASDTYATSINASGTLGCGTVTNAGLAGSIAYSKLSLTGAILNADLAGSIAVNKLVAQTVSRALVSDGSGFISPATTTSTEIGYVNGVTSAIQTQLDAKQLRSTLTAKGDIYVATASNTVTNQAIGTDGFVLTADAAQTNGLKWAASASAPSSTDELSNCTLATSVGSSALTIALKDQAGSDPSGGSACKIGMRSSTVTSGVYNQRSVTGALSVVVSSGSTLGHTSAVAWPIYVYAIDNAGTVELAVSSTLYREGSVISTTAEGGAGAADTYATIYSTTTRSNVPFRLIARLTSNQTTAGTYAAVPTKIELIPIDTVSVVSTSSTGERVERALVNITGASACSITSQSGSWLSSCAASGSQATLTIAGGIFSAAPTCVCTGLGAVANAICRYNGTIGSATSIGIGLFNTSNVAQNDQFTLICQGPR